jgi:transcriptional regulator with XRE-family HTH domain
MDRHEPLRKLVEQATQASRNVTLHRLAKKFGVGYSTLRRFMQKEGEPGANTISALVHGLLKPADAAKFLQDNYADLPISKSASFYASHGLQAPAGEFEPRKFSREEFLAFVITQSRNRVSRQSLKAFIGHKADKAIEKLSEDGVLEVTEGEVRSKADDIVIYDDDGMLSNMKLALEEFDKDCLDVPGNMYTLKYQGLNDEGVNQMHRLCFEFLERADAIMFNPKFKGDRVLLCGLFQNLIEGDLI